MDTTQKMISKCAINIWKGTGLHLSLGTCKHNATMLDNYNPTRRAKFKKKKKEVLNIGKDMWQYNASSTGGSIYWYNQFGKLFSSV